ncbi:NAD-dependent epimerase/dehydratase family protein [Rhodopseudomonas palustris]
MVAIPEDYTLASEDLDHVDRRMGGLWKDLDGAHVLITGGTGFFGIWLTESLLWAIERRGLKADVTVLSRSPGPYLAGPGRHLANRRGLQFVQGNITRLPPGLPRFSHIIHAASESKTAGQDDWATRHLAAAIEGTQAIIELASTHRSEAVLLTTSGAVYKHSDTIIDRRCVEGLGSVEDFASENTLYAQSKRMMEAMVAIGSQNHGYRALIARCFAFIGPYLALDSNYAIGNFIRNAMNGNQIVVNGDGTPLRSYLYSADLVIWLLTILVKGKSGRPYNVGGERAYSIAELAHEVRACVGAGEVVVRQAANPTAPISAYLPDIDRARSELGLDVYVDLRDAICRTVDWHRTRSQSTLQKSPQG